MRYLATLLLLLLMTFSLLQSDEADLTDLIASRSLTIVEKQKLLQLLIERVDYDGRAGQVTIHFHPSGLETLLTDSLENAA